MQNTAMHSELQLPVRKSRPSCQPDCSHAHRLSRRYCNCGANRWLGYRLDILGSNIAFVVMLICVYEAWAGTLASGLVGLAL